VTLIGLWGALAALGLALSALFSGLETGIYTINRVRLLVRSERGDAGARRLLDEVNRPDRLLATLLVANNVANYLGTFSVASILQLMGVGPLRALLVNAAIVVPAIFVFGETLPKDLFRTHTDAWTYRWSWLLGWSRRVLTWTALVPLVRAFGGLGTRVLGGQPPGFSTARQRISELIREGRGAGLLSESQTTLADRALALHARVVADEMTPWSRVVRVQLGAAPPAREEVMRQSNFTRLPVVDRDGRVAGILCVLDALLRPQAPTAQLMSEPLTVAPGTPIAEAIRALRHGRAAMAIVAGTDGKPRGLVTIKDLVEPLTGELVAW
jgi:CBS domain containing-hemolysin-like protein